jgi:6-phosphofructokinase
MAAHHLLIAQGGGPTAVINQSLVGAVLAARRMSPVGLAHDAEMRVYGAQFGVRGIVDEKLIDLGEFSAEHLEQVARTPGAALGSTRDKPDEAYCQEIFRVLQAREIRCFCYIGGNDTSETLRILHAFARDSGYPLVTVHIPKTIDNDLMENDHTPGYPSAARFVASAFAGIECDNRALPGIYVGVVMGRHAGFLTAAAAMARQEASDGPHLVYLPEVAFDAGRFLSDVKSVYDRYGRCVIAVSEGIHDAHGRPIATTGERDAHGNIQLSGSGALADQLTALIKQNLGLKRVRGDTFGYMQRSFLGVVSSVDQREARAAGEQGARYGLQAGESGSVAIQRQVGAGGGYAVHYPLVPLEHVAGRTRVMPPEFIAEAGNDVTPAFRDYLRPLLGDALPVVAHLHRPVSAS